MAQPDIRRLPLQPGWQRWLSALPSRSDSQGRLGVIEATVAPIQGPEVQPEPMKRSWPLTLNDLHNGPEKLGSMYQERTRAYIPPEEDFPFPKEAPPPQGWKAYMQANQEYLQGKVSGYEQDQRRRRERAWRPDPMFGETAARQAGAMLDQGY